LAPWQKLDLETLYENVWTTTECCDMKNLPRSVSRHTCKVKKSHSKPSCFKNVWKRKDRLWLWTNSGD